MATAKSRLLLLLQIETMHAMNHSHVLNFHRWCAPHRSTAAGTSALSVLACLKLARITTAIIYSHCPGVRYRNFHVMWFRSRVEKTQAAAKVVEPSLETLRCSSEPFMLSVQPPVVGLVATVFNGNSPTPTAIHWEGSPGSR